MNYKKIRQNSLKGIYTNARLIAYFIIIWLIYDQIVTSGLGIFTFPLTDLALSFLVISLSFYCLNIARNTKLTNKPFLELFNVNNFGKYFRTWIQDISLSIIITFVLAIPFMLIAGFSLFGNYNFSPEFIQEAEYLINTQDYMAILENTQLRNFLADFSYMLYTLAILLYFATMYKKYLYFIAYDSKVNTSSTDIVKLSFYFSFKNIFKFIRVDLIFIIILFITSELPYIYLIETGSFLMTFGLPFLIIVNITKSIQHVFYAGLYEEVVRLNENKPLVRKVIKEEIIEQLLTSEKQAVVLEQPTNNDDFSI